MPAPRGRFWLGIWLAVVLATLAAVVMRQTASVVVAGELATRRSERAALEAARADLIGRIRSAESRSVLVPRAARLGLRLPADSEIVLIQGPELVRP
jgi:hypothetical protein